MSTIRRWFLLGGSILAVIMGFSFGLIFLKFTIKVFDEAIQAGGSNPVLLIKYLADGIKGILGWIVFGITMTNAMIVSSTLSLVLMVSDTKKD